MKHLPKFLVTLVVLAAVATVAMVAGPDGDSRPDAVSSSSCPTATFASLDPVALSSPSTETGIRFFEKRTESNDRDAASWTILGQLYLQRGRETGSDDWNLMAEEALRTALAIVPDFTAAQAELASALSSQHRFVEAIEIAETAFAADARRIDALATIGDSQISLGRIEDAAATYAQLAGLDAGPSAIARLAHVAELRGRPREAIELMEAAVTEAAASGLVGERAAWYRYRLGDLHRHLGDWDAARRSFDDSLQYFDEFNLALLGHADVALKTGDLAGAEAYLDRAEAAVGVSVDSLLARADLAVLRGEDDLAATHVEAAIEQLERYDSRLTGRDLALVLADNELDTERALLLAESAVADRPDVFSHDVHAWALLKAGRTGEARAASERAMTAGIEEPSFYLHAAHISIALGEPERAVSELEHALAINPRFHPIDGPAAHQLLQALEAEG